MPKPTLVKFPERLADVPQKLREAADIADKDGSLSAVVILEGNDGTMTVMCYGCAEQYRAVGLLQTAVHFILSPGEQMDMAS